MIGISWIYGSPRFLGIMIIAITLIVLIAGSIIAWKIVVSEKRVQAKIFKDRSDQLILGSNEVSNQAISETYRKTLAEKETKAKEEYKMALRTFWGYIIGALVGSLIPAGIGVFFLAVGKHHIKEDEQVPKEGPSDESGGTEIV